MITIEELKNLVEKEYDARCLASHVRYSALNKVVQYIKDYHNGSVLCLNENKSTFTSDFERITGSRSDAAKSAINELYNQYQKAKNTSKV